MSRQNGIGGYTLHFQPEGLTTDDWSHMSQAYLRLTPEHAAHGLFETQDVTLPGASLSVLKVETVIDVPNKQVDARLLMQVPGTYVFGLVLVFDDGDWVSSYRNDMLLITDGLALANEFDHF